MEFTGKNRKITDQFYTSNKTAQFCVEKFLDEYPTAVNIIEPSAGDGAFVHFLCRFPNNTTEYFRAFDIEPKNIRTSYVIPIEKRDFLTYNFKDFLCAPSNPDVYFIGNPPFGRQSSLAKKFIKHITSYPKAKVIAFILPKSFKKSSMQKCFPLNWWKIREWGLDDNSFIIENKAHDVPCVFQIWEKKLSNREIPPKEAPRNFNFTKKENNPDFSLRRVGVYAGKIDQNIDKSTESHYFIKLNNSIDKESFIKKYSTIQFETDNTVGPRSISKQEFTREINQITTQ